MRKCLQVIDIIEARLLSEQSPTKKRIAFKNGDGSAQDKRPNLTHTNSAENRLDDDDVESTLGASALGSVFDVNQRCMYLQCQGDMYSKLFHAKKHPESVLNEFAKRALEAYEAATDLSSSSLHSTDVLRLLNVCSYCEAVHALPPEVRQLQITAHLRRPVDVKSSLNIARRLAERTYYQACSYSCQGPISEQAIFLLQTLRDKWIAPLKEGNEAAFNSDEEEAASECEEDEDVEERNARETHEAMESDNLLAAMLAKKKKLQTESKKRLISAKKLENEGGKKAQSLGKQNTAGNIQALGVFTAVDMEPDDSTMPFRVRSAQNMVRRLRGILSPPLPHDEMHPTLLLDRHITHGSTLRSALKRIFNVYVQGSALVGFQSYGSNVELGDGQSMNIGTFLLQGPYIGFRGFAAILRDFGISKLPLNKSQISAGQSRGKFYGDGNFPAIFVDDDSLQLFHNGNPPLSIKESAMLFLECARSSRPALSVSKYLQTYSEIAKEMEAFEDSFSGPLEWAALPVDCWGQLSTGLNYMQFLDFIGKAAILAYSSDQFNDVLPTKKEKIEHFLHAQMGLLDPRRWLPKVEGRVHALNVQIEQIKEQQARLVRTTSTSDSAGILFERQLSRQNSVKNTDTPTNVSALKHPPFVKSYK